MKTDFMDELEAFDELCESWMDYNSERVIGGVAEEERRSLRVVVRKFVKKRSGEENGC